MSCWCHFSIEDYYFAGIFHLSSLRCKIKDTFELLLQWTLKQAFFLLHGRKWKRAYFFFNNNFCYVRVFQNPFENQRHIFFNWTDPGKHCVFPVLVFDQVVTICLTLRCKLPIFLISLNGLLHDCTYCHRPKLLLN